MAKKKREYKKPSIKKVWLQMDEAVLTGCKAFQGDSRGQGGGKKYCGHGACQLQYGS